MNNYQNLFLLSACLCSFFESLAGPFRTKVDSLVDSFQRCADSDGLTFLFHNFYSQCFFPAVGIVKNSAHSTEYLITACPVAKYLSVCVCFVF